MDSQTITLMATTAVGLLIPYFAKAGEAVAKNVGECIECCACVAACPKDAIEHSSC